MSRLAKRQKLQEEQAAEKQASVPSALEIRARQRVPAMLFFVVKLHLRTLESAQLHNPQVKNQIAFNHYAPQPRLDKWSKTHAVRLRAVGCAIKGKLVRLMMLGVGGYTPATRDRHRMIQNGVKRVTAGLVATVRNGYAKEAEELCASGQCAAAKRSLKWAILLGDLPSLARMAWLLIEGREGLPEDSDRAFEYAEAGYNYGCHHCEGVLAYCYTTGMGVLANDAYSLQLARNSSTNGSGYGHLTLGMLFWAGLGVDAQDYDQALDLFLLAAEQGLDQGQHRLGDMNQCAPGATSGCVRDGPLALRWYRLAAAQGYGPAMLEIAHCYRCGFGVRKNKKLAIRWYMRAKRAGVSAAAKILKKLKSLRWRFTY